MPDVSPLAEGVPEEVPEVSEVPEEEAREVSEVPEDEVPEDEAPEVSGVPEDEVPEVPGAAGDAEVEGVVCCCCVPACDPGAGVRVAVEDGVADEAVVVEGCCSGAVCAWDGVDGVDGEGVVAADGGEDGCDEEDDDCC